MNFSEIIVKGTVYALIALLIGYVITSVVLFVRDGINAKKENRPRKVPVIVMFIIAIVVTIAGVSLALFLSALAYAIMRSM